MRKKLLCIVLITSIFFTSCGNSKENKVKTDDLQLEIKKVLETVSYENLEICFSEIDNYEGQELVIANTCLKCPSDGLSYEESVKRYANEIFPRLLDIEKVDTNNVYDINTRSEDGEYRFRTYGKDYDDVIGTIGEYDAVPSLVYADNENWTELYYMGDWLSGVYLTKGILSSYAKSLSTFSAVGIIKEEKVYDCRWDNLSDTYYLMDGEKSVLEAKEEIEKYLNDRYPLLQEDNDIDNVVYKVTVGKIANTDYYAYRVYRTLSYNEIPIREMPSTSMIPENEFAFMAEGAMCESNKLDVTIGLINCYAKPEVERVISRVIPFQEVMDRVAYYLTGETKFQLLDGSLEYRMFVKGEGYQLVPYWCFIAKNPNDDSMIKIYVDMETGETVHFTY